MKFYCIFQVPTNDYREPLENGVVSLQNLVKHNVESHNAENYLSLQDALYRAFDKRLVIPKNRLEASRTLLGSGHYGTVYAAELKGHGTVALKIAHESYEAKQALILELKMLQLVCSKVEDENSHENVLQLIGAVTELFRIHGELFVCLEYCKYGSLGFIIASNRDRFVDQRDPPVTAIY